VSNEYTASANHKVIKCYACTKYTFSLLPDYEPGAAHPINRDRSRRFNILVHRIQTTLLDGGVDTASHTMIINHAMAQRLIDNASSKMDLLQEVIVSAEGIGFADDALDRNGIQMKRLLNPHAFPYFLKQLEKLQTIFARRWAKLQEINVFPTVYPRIFTNPLENLTNLQTSLLPDLPSPQHSGPWPEFDVAYTTP
jgi:hypothetical protein